jgi:O-phosphoseryl-tRNA(Cys) synthetase
MADTLPSINLELKRTVENFITSQNKKIDVRGPIFIDIKIEKK